MFSLVIVSFVFLVAYLIGAIPFGYWIARWRGVDIFQHGSGNIGATNVGRVLGHQFGMLCFVLDFAKGACPTALAMLVSVRMPLELPPDSLAVIAGLAAFLGHMFPVYLRFRGGKGVATGAGVVTMLLPGPTALGLLVWVVMVSATRYVSLASLTAAAALCVGRLAWTPTPFAPDNVTLTLFCFIAAGLVMARHRANLQRLLQGNENRLRESLTMLRLTKIVHVLSLGMWFGTVVFFTFFGALTLFHTFETIAAQPQEKRPTWFPVAPGYDKDEAARKEQGTRAAGAAVGPLFDWYFLIQGVCGFLAVGTALAWRGARQRIHQVRVNILIAAVATVLIGWPLERYVSELRVQRHATSDALLQSAGPVSQPAQDAAAQAKSAFFLWHTISLLWNFVTVILVTIAMAQAAFLPDNLGTGPTDKPKEEPPLDNAS
ncbi:MAG: glycerol-3-phosphate 1-O-acyltransferase PlsY [Gemmataceae bacterium]